MKVALAGNPNAGKTTLFNALTKSNLRTGNFHGVTTKPAFKSSGGVTYVDVPGAYDFSVYSMEEKSALEEIASADVIVNVVDALTLENSINFTRGLISRNTKTVVFLTKTDRLAKRGGKVDAAALSRYLGVPVMDCSPRELKKRIEEGINFNVGKGVLKLSDAYFAGNLKTTRADSLFCNNLFSMLIFVGAITFTFFAAFHPSMPGAALKALTEELICDKLCNLITGKMQHVPTISLLKEAVFGGVGGVLAFIPQLAVLYLLLTLLDESGIMSALAFTTDGLFEKVNLSGRAAFSLVSGFGCTAAAILTTRGYSTRLAQRRTIAVLPFIPCGAKLPVFLTLLSPLFENPFPVVTCFYFAGVLVALVAAALSGGKGEEMLSEVTSVCVPSPRTVVIKLFFYLKGFIIKVTGVVAIFCVISWFASHFSFSCRYVSPDESILASVSRALLPLFAPMGVRDWEICYALLCGFIAKENVAAAISILCPNGTGLPLSSALGVCAFLLLCPACVSAFSASCKEVGWKFSLKCVLFQTALAFAGGYTVNLFFSLL